MSCIFCDIVANKTPSWKVYEDEFICAFFDYSPASKGHVLIVPKKHYANIFDIPVDLLEKIIVLAKKISLFYKEKLGIEHINLINSNGKFANQVVNHYHMHIIPRAENDTINISWHAKEELRDSFDELQKILQENL